MIAVIVAALLLVLLWAAVRWANAPQWLFYGAAIIAAILLLLSFADWFPPLAIR